MYGLTPLDVLGNIIAWSIPIPLALFVFFYGTRPGKTTDGAARWYRRRWSNLWLSTRIGQTIMYQKIAWLFFMLYISVTLAIGKQWTEGRDLVRFIVYVALVSLAWEMFFGLRALQKSPTPEQDASLNAVRDDDEVAEDPVFRVPAPLLVDSHAVEHDTQPVTVIAGDVSENKEQS